MNIFVLDEDIEKSAQYHCDRHVNKMILEGTQMLCTVLQQIGKEAPYKATHENHPCTIWTGESLSNWKWLRDFIIALNLEKRFRYGGLHKSAVVAVMLEEPDIEDVGLTPFAQAMPSTYKNKDVVKAYRAYYRCEKKHFATWKNRPIPYWMLNN